MAVAAMTDIDTVCAMLDTHRLVHLECDTTRCMPSIGAVIARFIKAREFGLERTHPEWRGVVVGPTFPLATRVVSATKEHLSPTAFNFRDTAIRGRRGHFRSVGPYPQAVQGMVGWNLFFVLVNSNREDILDAIWPSVVSDTTVLAINSHLFSYVNDFEYSVWRQTNGHQQANHRQPQK